MTSSSALAPSTSSTTAAFDALPRLAHKTSILAVEPGKAPPGRYLVVDDGAESRLLPLHLPVTTVGRSVFCDVEIDDHTVSRRHAMVALRHDGAWLLDDRSTNGTFVNGRKTGQVRLRDGDVVVLGRVAIGYLDTRRWHPARESANNLVNVG